MTKRAWRMCWSLLTMSAAITGCSPTAPSLDPMQQWASDHAHETCIFRGGTKMLVPIGTQRPTDVVVTISLCNPAE